MSDNNITPEMEAQFDAAKEITKVGVLTSLKLADTMGVPQGVVILQTATACLATLISSGMSDEGIDAVVAAAKAAILRSCSTPGLEGMLPAGNA